MSPLVSVIMPCFNAGRMLRPALESVIRQTHSEIEIIFVDNNSTDGSVDVAQRMAATSVRPFQLTHCPEQGVNHARNHGYKLARGQYIQWLDADDALEHRKIALQIAALESSQGDDIAYGDWIERRFSSKGETQEKLHRLQQLDDQATRTLAGIWYPPHLYLLRRSAADRLQEAQGWWPSRPVATDVEYSALAALLGMRFRHVPGAVVEYNIWSSTRISAATPYPLRAATLRDIFLRLGEFAASGSIAATLTRRQRILLEQGWDIWRLPRGSVSIEKLPGRFFMIRHRRSGRGIKVRPREAAIVNAMQAAELSLTTCHHALMLADTVPEAAGEHIAIVAMLQLLQREGFLDRVAGAEPDTLADAVAHDDAATRGGAASL